VGAGIREATLFMRRIEGEGEVDDRSGICIHICIIER
jgi:hypothetical protein